MKATFKRQAREYGRPRKQAKGLTSEALAAVKATARLQRVHQGKRRRKETEAEANKRALVDLALLQVVPDGLLCAPWHNQHPKGGVNDRGHQSLLCLITLSPGIEKMAKYMGNTGHLMQHWTLCKLLETARGKGVVELNYIDTHAMAPWATEPIRPNEEFGRVRDGLLDQAGQESLYEQIWHRIAQMHHREPQGYPSSAAFVHELWQAQWNLPYSLLLCEICHDTAHEIEEWLQRIAQQPGCLSLGDWRVRFARTLPNPLDAGSPENPLTFVAFDPDRYEMNPDQLNTRRLGQEDLELALQALEDVNGGILIQVSTYNNGPKNQNPQDQVVQAVDEILAEGEFCRVAKIRANKKMMSLVYAKKVEWAPGLEGLGQQFNEWRRRLRQR